MFTYLITTQILLAVGTGLGWLVATKHRETLPYGVLHGLVATCLGLALAGMTQPAPAAEETANVNAFIVLHLTWSTVVVVIGGLVLAWATDRGHLPAKEENQPTWRTVLATVIYATVGGLAAVIYFLSHWVATTFAGVQADQLLFFMLGGNPGTTPEQEADLLLRVVLPVIGAVLASAMIPVLLRGVRRREEQPSRGDEGGPSRVGEQIPARRRQFLGFNTPRRTTTRRVANIALALTVVSALVYSVAALPLIGVARSYFVRSNFIAENYVEPTDQILHFPDKPKNFIHIYLESMENSYYGTDEGGYLEQNLMPDLGELTKENTTFSHTDHFGGPLQTYGANHSLAGMMNFQAGVPMIPFYNSSVGGRISYPNFTTIGDILHQHGYETSFMLGTFSNWHKMGDYYRQHGKFQIFDLQTARERQLVPPNYFVFWGLEDDKLYEYAKDEMTRLAGGEKPFYFILENADTHPNGGYVSPRMKDRPSDKQYGNVIHYSQAETVKLVRWIQAQPWYKDTVIVLTGDHQSMDNEFFVGWDPSYERTVVNVFINSPLADPGRARTHNRVYAPFDFFPTIMASLGITVEGDRLGLGTNLYSDKPTLLEQYGFEKVNEELQKRSNFYEEHRVGDITREDID